jgi:hypothetical protein
MVDFQFIFISLLYLVILLFIHSLLKTSSKNTKPLKPSLKKNEDKILSNVSQPTTDSSMEQFDVFKPVYEADDNELVDEWAKVYEQTQATNPELLETSSMNPEYTKTTLLDSTADLNPSSPSDINVNPFDEYDGNGYLKFSNL